MKSKSESFNVHEVKASEVKLTKLRNKNASSNFIYTKNSVKKKRKWIKRSKYKHIKKSTLRQHKSIVFDYSSITLNQSMEKALNRGLNNAAEIKPNTSPG